MEEYHDLNPMEELDLEVFTKFVTPHYNPNKLPFAFGIGVMNELEEMVIRKYHEDIFGINGMSVKVGACNIIPFSANRFSRAAYDFEVFHSFAGDARTNYPILSALGEFHDDMDRKMDLVYIRNPDLVNLSDWGTIFITALEWTENNGALVTMIRRTDERKYNNLLYLLKDAHGIEPLFSGETKICVPPQLKDNFFDYDSNHFVGIFKSNN